MEPEADNVILFGELCVLGVSSTRTASVTAKTIVFVNVLHRNHLVQALEEYPKESARFHELVKLRTQNMQGPMVKKTGTSGGNFLSNVSFCDFLSKEFVRFLAQHIQERLYCPGQSIFKEGDRADEVFMLHEGEITLHANNMLFQRMDTTEILNKDGKDEMTREEWMLRQQIRSMKKAGCGRPDLEEIFTRSA